MGYRHTGARLSVALAFSSILLVGTAAWAQGPSRAAPITSASGCERWW